MTARKSQRAPNACSSCAKRRVRCDKQVPCGTCLARGLETTCAREVVNVKGRVTSAKQRVPVLSYFELQQENNRLKAELFKSKLLTQRKSTSSTYFRQEISAEVLENQTNLQHGKSDYHQQVWNRTDIWMPSKDCSDILLHHGFTWTSWIHFAVHLQTFELEHESAWITGVFLDGDPLWLAIYFGFIAMSLMFMDEDEARRAGLPLENTSELVQNWYGAALFFLNEAEFLRNPNFKTVQSIAILLGLAKNVGDFDLQPVLQATGIRIGQILGMDQEPPMISDDPVMQEISRRVWWTLVICEWLSIPARPPCIHQADFNVRLPLVLSDEELTTRLINEPNMATKMPRPVDYHNAMIFLAKSNYHFQIQMRAIENLDGDNLLEDLVLTTDEALANIISQLPSHLLEISGGLAKEREQYPPWVLWQQTTLSLSFLFYRMKVNRVLQHRWASSSDVLLARSKAICLDSANTIVSMVKQHKVVLARHRPWATTSALFSAALTLAAEAKRLDSNAAEEYIDRVQTCFSFFEYIKDHSALATRVLSELRVFCFHDSESTSV
ncbi:transcriptional regulator family: Fungal Specific TF [Penicillium roqueforti]|nr:transcriptional regulator family: Fungal Specific TF [Penicillium roqueforti]KAI3251789.1 transcriptional regulator family: Fungal Specific TF [Penicillium roqueforti]